MKSSASESVVVSGGTWVYSPEQLPYATEKAHPYFTAPEGQTLSESLRNSAGREAKLISFHMESGWLITTWGGLVVMSGNERMDRELSSGKGQRLFFQFPAPTLRDTVVALQRNSSNYFHFVTEVMPSLMAWEKNLHDSDPIAVAAAPFASSLLRLAGFKQPVSLLHQPASIRASNVNLLRLLPVGYFNLALLRELSRRVVHSVNPGTPSQEIVFLSRARKDRRILTNEGEALEIIRRRFPSVDLVVPGEMSVEDQVRRCHSARIIFATHGAHATNLLWSDRLEHFVELGAKKDRTSIAMAGLLGAHTQHCLSHPITPGEHWSDHTCELDALKNIVAAL